MSEKNETVVREEKIRQLIAQEISDGDTLASEARRMVGYLLLEKKGYSREDVRSDLAFEVKLGDETAWSTADFLVSLDGRPLMLIKCAAGSLDSRQRQAVAAARVIASPPLPVAVVADPENAVVLDTATGKPVGEGFGAIPVKDRLREIAVKARTAPLPPEKAEKEKRILLAFDAIKCSVPKGADGKGIDLNASGSDCRSR